MTEEDISLPDHESNPLLPNNSDSKTEVITSFIHYNGGEAISPSAPEPDSPSPTSSSSSSNTKVTVSPTKSLTGVVKQEDEDKISPDNPDAEDQTDECSCLTLNEPLGDPTVTGQPTGGEYSKILELLKEAELSADPEYENKKRNMEFLTKYNPRGGPETRFSLVDYCCNVFQCCALCIEG